MFIMSFDWENLEKVEEQPSMFVLACAGLGLHVQACSCVRSLDLLVRMLFHAHLCLFFSSYMRKFQPMQACKILHTRPHSCPCEKPSKNPSLGIWTPFSFVFHLFTIFTSFLTIFASNYISHVISHSIVNLTSLSHYFFHLSMNLISSTFCRFYLHILAEGVLVGH